MDIEYVIFSTSRRAFWKRNEYGYTRHPFLAGRFSRAEVLLRWDHFNTPDDDIAIPLTCAGLWFLEGPYVPDPERIQWLSPEGGRNKNSVVDTDTRPLDAYEGESPL